MTRSGADLTFMGGACERDRAAFVKGDAYLRTNSVRQIAPAARSPTVAFVVTLPP